MDRLRYMTATTWHSSSESMPQKPHQSPRSGRESHRKRKLSKMQRQPTSVATAKMEPMFHLNGVVELCTLSLEVAITVKSLIKLKRIRTQVGKVKSRAVMVRKKKPRMRHDDARRYLMYASRRRKILRERARAVMMVLRPGAVRTMSAADFAASVAPATAIPQLARLRAGASLTPSPVMPTTCPSCCRDSTILNLCSGNTPAKPFASRASLPRPPAETTTVLRSSQMSLPRMLTPIPSRRAVSMAIAR
mmetsp:Transcript_8160/g.27100  ORF Transcript_8160/g.27100 Transcript_8160/m.27100 type:complete len:248 (+) Transcript_8160:716-1459(+)